MSKSSEKGDVVTVVRAGIEGAGTSLYARRDIETDRWLFWREWSSMSMDENDDEVWLGGRTEETTDLDSLISDGLFHLYPTQVAPQWEAILAIHLRQFEMTKTGLEKRKLMRWKIALSPRENWNKSDWPFETAISEVGSDYEQLFPRITRQFSDEEMIRLRRGVLPKTEDDPWFIYLDDWDHNNFSFVRPASAKTIFQCDFAPCESGRGWRIYTFGMDKSDAVGLNYLEIGIMAAANLLHVIDTVLLHQTSAPPLNVADAISRIRMPGTTDAIWQIYEERSWSHIQNKPEYQDGFVIAVHRRELPARVVLHRTNCPSATVGQVLPMPCLSKPIRVHYRVWSRCLKALEGYVTETMKMPGGLMPCNLCQPLVEKTIPL